MSRGVRIRLAAFVVLSALGIVYVAGSYLGFVDRVLGRGYTIHATLPTSGGLFKGSEVTYRGVKVGKVSAMRVAPQGLAVDLALEDDAKIPLDSKIYVHNLSAVGEQYLDLVPPDGKGPYAREGDTLHGDADSLPVDEGDLLVQLDQFVESVNKRDLQVTVKELGTMFHDTGTPLQRMIDSGTRFIDEASAHQPQTVALLEHGLKVLRTQQDEGENIRTLSRDLNLITGTLRHSDKHLRQVIQGTPGAARELDAMLTDLEPTLPVLLGNAIGINQVMDWHLAGLEQLLVTFPRAISSGFTGTPAKGGGRVNMQFSNKVQPCTEGYKPKDKWRPASDLTDSPIFPARCLSGPPYNVRGTKYAPESAGAGSSSSPGRLYRTTYDPRSGLIDGVVDREGRRVRYVDPGNLSVLGDDAWKWLLVGPVSGR